VERKIPVRSPGPPWGDAGKEVKKRGKRHAKKRRKALPEYPIGKRNFVLADHSQEGAKNKFGKLDGNEKTNIKRKWWQYLYAKSTYHMWHQEAVD